MSEKAAVYPHHRKVGPCLTRPPYRDGKRKRAVKVYTIADESQYLLFFGVPSLDLMNALKNRIEQTVPLVSIREVNYPESEEFTTTYLVKFDCVNSARRVRRRLDDASFYGGFLHIVYAPEYESVAECRVKLHSHRRFNEIVLNKEAAAKLRELGEHQQGPLESEKPGGSAEEHDEPALPPAPSPCPPRPPQIGPVAPPSHSTTFPNPYARSVLSASSQRGDSRQSGDALEDARLYWASRGLDVPLPTNTSHRNPPPAAPTHSPRSQPQ
uniref:RNA-binding protein 48 n=1 Tax=Mesocestoides corti TaxID=53468 RepID=A0A5K3FWS3_MESCO